MTITIISTETREMLQLFPLCHIFFSFLSFPNIYGFVRIPTKLRQLSTIQTRKMLMSNCAVQCDDNYIELRKKFQLFPVLANECHIYDDNNGGSQQVMERMDPSEAMGQRNLGLSKDCPYGTMMTKF